MTCYLDKLSGQQKAEWLLRWGMGFFLLMAGLGKVAGGVALFVAKMSGGFTESFLPIALVTGFLYLIPFFEILLGIWLVVGWRRECALWTTGLLFILFIFGHKVMGDMAGIPALMTYLLVIAATLSLHAAWNVGCSVKCR